MNTTEGKRADRFVKLLQRPNLMPRFSPEVIALAVRSALDCAGKRAEAAIGRVSRCLSQGGSAYRTGFMNLYYATQGLTLDKQAQYLKVRILA
jgi:hypothetical protein